jgi:hypothetical protein
MPGSMTCSEGITHIGEEERLAIEAAVRQGSCDDITLPWGESLEQWIDWPARQCCSSFPATACAPNAKLASVCMAETDFKESAVLHAWCEFHGVHISKETCAASGCSPWEHEFEGIIEEGCYCEAKEPCENLNGTYYQETCGESASHYDVDTRSLLQQFSEGTSCDSSWMSWGELASNWVKGQADRCCESFPKTVCDPSAELLTPCVSSDDFNSSAVIHEWCDYFGSEPSYEECEDLGFCHCHTERACTHFGGKFHQETCGEYMRHWDEGGHGLKMAKELGSCTGVTTMWGDPLQESMHHYASQCCMSFPATACGDGQDELALNVESVKKPSKKDKTKKHKKKHNETEEAADSSKKKKKKNETKTEE